MNSFLKQTISDIRGGRQSWRVISLFGGSSFLISVAATFIRQPF